MSATRSGPAAFSEAAPADSLRSAIATALDRRRFIKWLGGTLAVAALPVAAHAAKMPSIVVRPSAERLDDWTIDDVWGSYPRYADPIGFGRRNVEPLPVVDPVDALFVE
jgi:hypothetical protein